MNLAVGEWIRWSTPSIVREGEIVQVSGPSIVVSWLGGERQVFPVTEGYFEPYGGHHYRMERIQRPPKASSIERDTKRGVMSISRAAAILGISPKRARAMLRGGQLRGEQVDGRWVSVELED